MKSSRLFLFLLSVITLIYAMAANAAGIDMDEPRRALGREGNVRIDAQLSQDTVSPGSPIGVTYQIQNLSSQPVAVAERVTDASYDEETRTITLSIGSEIPGENAPRLTLIQPGEKKVFRTAATAAMNVRSSNTAFSNAPRYVQVKVSILRDLAPFAQLIEKQARPQRMSDELFDQWLASNDTIYLNALPVRYQPRSSMVSAAERSARGGRF
ncbi:MAG TPA: hypothetical protein VGF48_05130 [Thermoanaerobaculia bacterium]|jgi:hypothetical protein